MKEIRLNGRAEKISESEKRCLSKLARNDFVAAVSDFSTHRRGGWLSTDLPQTAARLSELGISIRFKKGVSYETLGKYSDNSPAQRRADRLFASRPRVQQAAVGDPRRINAILAQL
jgi:hypothetical protein|tara:strand:- start:183 stop:530 length:348 start_codon:yes stop_codon:yes gene_type:complete